MASFTALNGGEQRPADRTSGSPTNKRSGSEERPEIVVSGATPRPSSRDLPSNPRDQWTGPGPERSSYAYPDVEGASKRKRSNSLEQRREAPSAPSAPNAPEERTPAPPSHPEPRDVYGTSQHQERDYRPYGDENRGERSDPWYSQHSRDERSAAYETQNSASQSEGQGEDSLRRVNSQMDSQQGYSPTSPDDESSYYGGSYTPEHRRDGSVIQSDPKKRKRNFSNRTKTGCFTCRRRKKKCDESKPECNNCLRGGFICQGYANQRGYQKTENKPPAVPLESKDPSYVPPGAYGMPQQPPYPSQPASLTAPPPKREPPPPYRGPSLRIDPPQGRPVLTDDERTASTIPTASVASPENKLSSLPSAYAQQGNPFPTPISAISSANNFEPRVLSKEYQRIPPLHDASRTEPETPQSSIPTTLPQINILNATTRTGSPSSHHQQPPPPPAPTSTTSAQVAAQLALSHSHFPPPARQATQKELMLREDWYQPFNKELVLERERCSAACWRFNNSTNPNNGVSGNERSRLFREILMPKEPINLSPSQQSPVSNIGHVGNDVVIEAPFTCDYGYNITIGQNVFIGRNCTIIDPCSVKIGNNTYIGPNVSLFAAALDTNPAKRMGSKSLQKGTPINIEEDVWIGGNVVILPGLKIGKGSTIGAGSVVTRDVPNFTIVGGNPAHVMRGIQP